MDLNAMATVSKTIMLAPPAKTCAGLAQYCVNETSYCDSQASKRANKITERKNVIQTWMHKQSV